MLLSKKQMEQMEQKIAEANEILKGNGSGLGVQISRIVKNNEDMDAFVMKGEQRMALPTVYLNGEMLDYSATKIVDFLMGVYEKHKDDIDMSTIEKVLKDKEYVLENVFPRLVSENNEERFKEQQVVYDRFMDMLVTYYVNIDIATDDDGHGSVTINEGLRRNLGISQEEIADAARKNAGKHAEMQSLAATIAILAKSSDMDLPVLESNDPINDVMVLSNESKSRGAAVILNDDVIAKISEKCGGRFAILPSSIHEVLVVPGNMCQEEHEIMHFARMVKEINESQVDTQDRLTDSVYVYENGAFSVFKAA